jgi:hypothetical protein
LNVETLKDFSIHFTVSCNFLWVCPHVCIFQFLSRAADVLTDYLGDLNEDIIKDNFVIVYQVFLLFLRFATCLILNIGMKQLLILLLPMWI